MNHLHQTALETIREMKLRSYGLSGHVACALKTRGGNLYTGICIDLPCSLGFCAEQAAIAEMLKHGESEISEIIAVDSSGSVLPPCGRCREFMSQVSKANLNASIHLPNDRITTLDQLLVERWDDHRD